MAIKADNIVIDNLSTKELDIDANLIKTAENHIVIVDGKPKKFNKISRYMLDMLTTEE